MNNPDAKVYIYPRKYRDIVANKENKERLYRRQFLALVGIQTVKYDKDWIWRSATEEDFNFGYKPIQ